MFRFFPRLAVERPVLTTMLVAVFAVLGAFALAQLRLELFPDVEFPVVTVTTAYPGAGPAEVETEITEPVEEALAGIANVDEMTSFSQDNLSMVIIIFDVEVSPERAANEVRDEIEGVRPQLPDGAEPPTVQRFDVDAFPIMSLALSGPAGVDALYELADDTIRDRLSRVDGVAQVDIVGGREREIGIFVHPDRLTAHGLALADVVELLQSENVSIPGGRLRTRGEAIPLRVVGEYDSLAEIRSMRIPAGAGNSIPLSDIAVVRDGFEELDQVARKSAEPAVSISIQQASGANTVDTAAGVRAELDAIRAEVLPPNTEVNIVRDESEFVEASVNDVLGNILIGILLTAAVLFFFLHSWRSTIIAALAMPTTIVCSFFLMDFMGFSLNVMTLMALGITVGILVTNTIVVIESISRHLEGGEDPRSAAQNGASSVGIAVAASTLTNVVVFAPIAFMEGIMGQFFYAFGLTVVFATLFSIFISFTLAPLIAARLLRSRKAAEQSKNPLLDPLWRRWDTAYDGLEDRYRRGLSWTLARPRNGWIVLGSLLSVALALFVVSASFITGDFIPEGDEGAAQVRMELPAATSIEETARVSTQAERRILELEGVTSTLTTIAGGAEIFAAGGGENEAEILVTLHGDADTTAVVRAIRGIMADIPDVRAIVTPTDPAAVGPGDEAPIQLDIVGPDYDVLGEVSLIAEEALARRPELSDVDNTLPDPRTELVFRPDRGTLGDYGITAAELGGVVQAAVDGADAGVYRGEVGEEIDIRVSLVEGARERPEQLDNLEVRTPRAVVPMSSLGAWIDDLAPTSIDRVDRQRAIRINVDLGEADLLSAVEAIEETMAEIDLPEGVRWNIGGEFELFEDALVAMLMALALAVILTYMVLAMILESFIHPFTIMLTLPLGAVGALLGLFLTGQSMNLFSMMAIIMLVGIVVNNAILILDYAAQLRRQGRTVTEALVEAAPIRLRPIVMSNVAIAVALLPQALATGEGAAFRVPMAVVTIGGVLVAAVFTLFLIPVIYTKLDRAARNKPERAAGEEGEDA